MTFKLDQEIADKIRRKKQFTLDEQTVKEVAARKAHRAQQDALVGGLVSSLKQPADFNDLNRFVANLPHNAEKIENIRDVAEKTAQKSSTEQYYDQLDKNNEIKAESATLGEKNGAAPILKTPEKNNNIFNLADFDKNKPKINLLENKNAASDAAFGPEFIEKAISAIEKFDPKDYNSTAQYIATIEDAKSKSKANAENYGLESVSQKVYAQGDKFARTAKEDAIALYNQYAAEEKRMPYEIRDKYGEYWTYANKADLDEYIRQMELDYHTFDGSSQAREAKYYSQNNSGILSAILTDARSNEGKTAKESSGFDYKYDAGITDSLEYDSLGMNVKFMTADERNLYFSLLREKGISTADEYFNDLLPTLQQRHKSAISETNQRLSEENALYGWLTTQVNKLKPLTSTQDFVVELADFVASRAGSNVFSGAAERSKTYRELLTESQGTIHNMIAEDSELGAWLYDMDITAGQFAVSLATSKFIGGAFAGMANADQITKACSQIMLSSSAAVSALDDAEQRGLSQGQAILYGVAVGLIEAATEKYSIEALMSSPKSIFTYVAQNIVSEGSEEIVAEIAGNVADMFLNGDKSSYLLSVKSYMEQGMTASEARKHAWADMAYEAILAGAGGALLGGIVGGGGVVSNQMSNITAQHQADTELGNAILKRQDAPQTIENIISQANSTQNKKLTRAAQRVDKTKNQSATYQGESALSYGASARDVGRLARIYQQQLSEIPEAKKSEIISSLRENGMTANEAKKSFKSLFESAVFSHIADGKINPDVQTLIETNPTAKKAYEELVNYTSTEAVQKRFSESPVTKVAEDMLKESFAAAGIESEDDVQIDDPVSVERIDDYGNVFVKTDSGKSVKWDSDSPTMSASAHEKMAYASLFSANGANAYLKLAPERASTKYKEDFDVVYSQGLRGEKFNAVDSNIGLEVQKAIYEAGKADLEAAAAKSRAEAEKAKKKEAEFVKKQIGFKSNLVTVSDATIEKIKASRDKGFSEQYNASVAVINEVAQMLQVKINIVASETDADGKYVSPNGVYNSATNTFTLDITAGMNNADEVTYTAIVKTLGHELTHFIQNWSPSKYIKLKNNVIRFLEQEHKEDIGWLNTELERIRADNDAIGNKITLEQAKDELVADSFENILSDVDFASLVLKTDKTLFEKVHSWLKDRVKSFKKIIGKAVENLGTQSAAGETIADAGKRAQALLDEWSDAFITALENSTAQSETKNESADQFRARYVSAEENKNILNLVEKVSKKQFAPNEKIYLGIVSETVAKKILSLVGVDVSGFKIAIEARQIEHILKDHGPQGRTDRSMANPSDLAKIEYILNEPDNIGNVGRTEAYSEFSDGKNRTAKTVRYEKKLGYETYYAVQAVPNTKARTLYIVTAFISKNGSKKEASQLINAQGPNATSENGSAKTPSNNISLTTKNVNEQFSARKGVYLNVSARLNLIEDMQRKIKTEKNVINQGELDKRDLLIKSYKKAVNAYLTSLDMLRIARYNEDTSAIVAASAAVQLRKSTITLIENNADFEALFRKSISGIEAVVEPETGLTEAALKRVQEVAKKATQDLTDAEREAILWTRRASIAGQRVYDAALRRAKQENSQILSKIRYRITQAIQKPSFRNSIPKGSEKLARSLIEVTKQFESLLRAKNIYNPSDDMIELIKQAAVIGAGGHVRQNKSHLSGAEAYKRFLTERIVPALDEVKASYSGISEFNDISVIHSEEISEYISKYISEMRETTESIVDQTDIHNQIFNGVRLIQIISHDLLNANTIIVNGKAENYIKLRNGLRDDIDMYSPGFLRKILSHEMIGNVLTPEVLLHTVFGATENAEKLYKIYEDGQNKYIDVVLSARDLFDTVENAEENGKKKFGKADKQRLFNSTPNISTNMKDMHGNAVYINEDHAITFVLAAKNDEYIRHIMYGGWAIPDFKKVYANKNAYLNGKTTQHILNGENENGEIVGEVTIYHEDGSKTVLDRIDFKQINDLRYEVKRYEAIGEIQKAIDGKIKLSIANDKISKIESKWKEKIIASAAKVESQLSEYSTALMKRIDFFYNTKAKEYLDEATFERYGFEKTLSKNHYYPIKVVKEQAQKAELNELTKQDRRISALGSMKNRQRSRIGVRLFGAISDFDLQVENTAKYCGYLNALNYIRKVSDSVMDKKTKKSESDQGTVYEPVTLTTYVDAKLGNELFGKYKKVLESDISGASLQNGAVEHILEYLNTAFIANALFFNFSPAIKQFSALGLVYPDAGLLSTVKGISKGAAFTGEAKGKSKIPIALNESQKRYVARYSRIYKYRSGGLISVDLASLKTSSNPITKFMSKHSVITGVDWMERSDSQVLGLQFYALLDSVQKQHPKWDVHAAATEAGKLLDKTIQKFQANYTILQRPPLLRSNGSVGMKILKLCFGTFKSQQLTMLNAQIDAVVKVETLKRQKDAATGEEKQRLNKELHAARKYAAKVAAASAVSYMVNAALAVGISLLYKRKDLDDALLEDAAWDMLQSYMSMLPGAGDVLYLILEQINDRGYYGDGFAEIGLISMVEDLVSVFTRIGEGDLTVDRVAKDVGKLLAPFGIPARNTWNIVKAFFEWLGIEIE